MAQSELSCVLDEDALSWAASGAFFLCDHGGTRLLGGQRNLRTLLGFDPPELDLPELFGGESRASWYSLFADEGWGDGPREELLRIPGVDGGAPRWIRVRVLDRGLEAGNRLVFARDETDAEQGRARLARAQSLEVDASARLQAAVLVNGNTPPSSAFDYFCSTIPSRLVDGDFLDVLRLSADSLDFILGDVMGKGMQAAILGASIKLGFVRAIAESGYLRHGLPSPVQICSVAEAAVGVHLKAGASIATLSYCRLHERQGYLEFVDCGHTPIIHFRRESGSCRRVKGSDMPMGFVDHQDLRSFSLPIRPGDVLLIYSDGLSETVGTDDGFFGEERIMYILRSYAESSATELVHTLVKLGFDFSASGFTDDVSLICIKATPGPHEHGWPDSTEGHLALELAPDSSAAMDAMATSLLEALNRVPNLPMDERDRVLLACHEALVNVGRHGLREGRGSCSIEWRIVDHFFSIEYSYEGAEYDWLEPMPFPTEHYGRSGYGVGIMHTVMDSVLLCQGFGEEKTLVMCRSLACQP